MLEESAAGVFTKVLNNGGWSNGTTCVVDQATIIYTVIHIGNILRAARSELFFEKCISRRSPGCFAQCSASDVVELIFQLLHGHRYAPHDAVLHRRS